MLAVDKELKTLYQQDSIPKSFTISFPGLSIADIKNDRLISESVQLSEALFSGNNWTFGSCEAATLEFECVNVVEDITGKTISVVQHVGDYTMPYGTFIIESAVKQNDKRRKKVTAYDLMIKFDVDVADWYNNLSFPLTLKVFRDSLFAYLNLPQESKVLINDDLIVEKTISPSQISGRDVIQAICEINGCFGHFNRNSIFSYVVLSNVGLYPAEDLYPEEDLYPSEAAGTLQTSLYKSCDYEEYVVEAITGLQIRQEQNDIGVVVGTDENLYAIQGNFLVYGKEEDTLQPIAEKILTQVKNYFYRPHKTVTKGFPYVEIGDALQLHTSNDVIETFIIKRSLKGILALQDTYSASGDQYLQDKSDSLKSQIEQLKGKSNVLERSVTETKSTITDLEKQTQSQFKQTSDAITAEVTRAKAEEGKLSSSIQQNAESISLKVDKNGVISSINQSAENITINASKINLSGYVTISNLTDGTTTISGSNIKTGTIDASEVNITNINASNITAGTISASRISSGTIELGANSTFRIAYGNFQVDGASATILSNNITIGYGSNSRTTIDGGYLTIDTTNCTINSRLVLSGTTFIGNASYSLGSRSVGSISSSATLSTVIDRLSDLRAALIGMGILKS